MLLRITPRASFHGLPDPDIAEPPVLRNAGDTRRAEKVFAAIRRCGDPALRRSGAPSARHGSG
ncbi:MAG: hypothetical protein J0H67_21595 [Rhodospirillales bacterium]|nr:hypothetical protein [Rhodospirillales bacterium]MBN8900810.1 hypothetical protein [Rhodospirillales bacterium]